MAPIPRTRKPAPGEPEGCGPARGKLILGLGNPGDRYAATRHNAGFRVVEELAGRRRLALRQGECSCQLAGDDEVLLARPLTYMNRSGYAARCLVERQGFDTDDLLVVYDEVHLPLGRIRLRPRGSPAGHRGMESVLESLATDEVPRLRLGVGREEPTPGEDLVAFVLAPFTADERAAAAEMIRRAADACEAWLVEGVEAAMSRFNG